MAVNYHIEQGERIVYLTVTGESPFAEWEAALRRVISDPEYVRGFNFLTDRRAQTDVPGPQFPRQVLRFLVEHTGEMGRYRWAAVSTREAGFQTLRMFTILAEEADIHVRDFRDYEEARRWLLGGGDAGA
jgi:hypothetical protein